VSAGISWFQISAMKRRSSENLTINSSLTSLRLSAISSLPTPGFADRHDLYPYLSTTSSIQWIPRIPESGILLYVTFTPSGSNGGYSNLAVGSSRYIARLDVNDDSSK